MYLLKTPGFVDTNAAAKFPNISLKIFGFVATAMGSERSRLTELSHHHPHCPPDKTVIQM